MKTKYVFLDIDGTLVGYDSKIPESALMALKAAKANGHKMIICSGRPLYMVYPELLSAIEFDGIISSGGACVTVGDKVIYESIIEGETLQTVVEYFRREGIRFMVQSKDHAFCEKDFEGIVIPAMLAAGVSKELIYQAYGRHTVVEDASVITGAEKLSYFCSPYPPSKISEDLSGIFYVVDFSIGISEEFSSFGELNNAGVTKATAIGHYLSHVGGSIEDTIAIGDSGNDLEMINFAHISVAMGNATDEIKAAADFTTTAVDNDGIYNAFVKLGLI
jgi:Cof subfamily protein (haloacid dehalogenase superfamily)